MEPSGALDRGEAVAREIGRQLREVRVARGETLEAIGKRMLIKPDHLEALEAGELDRLPSRHHAAGYARAYAKQLGLDGDELGCPLLALSGWPPPEPDPRSRQWWHPVEPLLCRRRQVAPALVAIVALGSVGWSVHHVRHAQHTVPTVAIASVATAPLPQAASSMAEATVPDSAAPAEPPAGAPVQESPVDTPYADTGQPVVPVAGGGQVAVAAVAQADTPAASESPRDAVLDQSTEVGAEPAPVTESAAAAPAKVEVSRTGTAPPRTPPRFSVQVASVRDRAAIPALWASMASRQRSLASLDPQAPQVVALPGRGTFYRVLAGSFATRSDAQAACDRLRSSGTRCIVVAS